MAKNRKPTSAPLPEPEARSCGPGEERGNRGKVRALIIGALAAGGVFQMNNWQVQAHGNRSSHSALAFRSTFISPDDYFVLRQLVTAPDADPTHELTKLSERLNSLQSQPAAAASAEVQTLVRDKRALESKIGAPSTTSQITAFIRQGDEAAAVAAIEGQGWPERVLGEYLWTLLDIAYLDGDSKKFTDDQRKSFVALARPAVAYSEKTLDATKAGDPSEQDDAANERAAEILHNVASFIDLMEDADADTLRLGQRAAERALQVRRELNQPATILRAHWMVAQYHVRAGQTAQALSNLNIALGLAQRTNDVPGSAWTKYSLANALRKSQPRRAAALDAEVRQIVNRFRGKDTTIEFLRQELGGA